MLRPVLSDIETKVFLMSGWMVAMSERTGMSVSQVTDEVLYKGLIGMQEMDEL